VIAPKPAARTVIFSLLLGGILAAGLEVSAMNDSFRLKSSAYQNNAAMPSRFTCSGQDISPPLHWSGTPVGSKSFVLIMDDPDAPDPAAPQMTWVHWVLYDIPVTINELAEGASKHLPAGIRSGKNDWKRNDYGGPCPPIGRHRYFHKLYALDTELPDLHHPSKEQLESAMRGHVLAQATLIGTYQKP
jgi:Raf kinase inhibitor-like YbhB/YbcL family protein